MASNEKEAKPPPSEGGGYAGKGRFAFKKQAPVPSKFDGRVNELKGHVYDLGENQADQFNRTTKEIVRYLGVTCKSAKDVQVAIEDLVDKVWVEPARPADTTDALAVHDYQEDKKEYKKDKRLYEENKETAYALVWSQCSDAMLSKVKLCPNHVALVQARDLIALLVNIREASFNVENKKEPMHALLNAQRRLLGMSQGKLTCAAYHEQFMIQVKVFEHCGGEFHSAPATVRELVAMNIVPAVALPGDLTTARTRAKEKYLARVFFTGADKQRFGKLIEETENRYVKGYNEYPDTVDDAHSLMANLSTSASVVQGVRPGSHGMAFATTGDDSAAHITCFNCGEQGHYAPDCPSPKNEEVLTRNQKKGASKAAKAAKAAEAAKAADAAKTAETVLHCQLEDSICLAQSRSVPSHWIILDCASEVDVFMNPNMLKNIRPANRVMNIKCNSGILPTELEGDLNGYGTVWYNPKCIANLLSLSNVHKKFKVSFDTSGAEPKFVMHRANGTERHFNQAPGGLFYADMSIPSEANANVSTVEDEHGSGPSVNDLVPTDMSDSNNAIAATGEATMLVNTVRENLIGYTMREKGQAELARRLQDAIGRPSTKDFIDYVNNNQLMNCSVTEEDIRNAEKIFGPNLGSLKGKTTKTKGNHVGKIDTKAPRAILERHRDVTICVDIMFVNRIAFLITISRSLKFGTVEKIPNRKAMTILKAINNVREVYFNRGFIVKVGLMDNEFEPLRGDLTKLGIQLNVVSNDEHVPEIERYIRTVKERTRCVYNTLPFKKIPDVMLVDMVQASVFWLNNFPPKDGVSSTMSPRLIMTGLKIDCNKHCRLSFGSYAQVHDDHDNTMATRTTGAIAMRPTGNVQGGYYFMSLTTGLRLTRNHWTVLPMPQEVIDRVHNLARRARANRNLLFADRNGDALLLDNDDSDDDDDEDYDPADDDDDDDDDDNDNDDMAPIENEHEFVEQILNPAGAGGVPAGVGANDYGVENDAPEPENEDDNEYGADNDAPESDVDDSADDANDNDEYGADNDAPENDYDDSTDDAKDNDEYDADNDAPENDNDDSADDANEATDDDANDPGEIPGVNLTGGYDANEDPGETTGVAHDYETTEIQQAMDAKYGQRSGERNLRPRKEPNYDHLHTTVDASVEHICMTQFSVKKGLKEFGQQGTDAVIAEMRQLEDRDVIEPKRASFLSGAQRKDALQYLMFLKKKRCGRIKGRGCADGRKQRAYMSKEDTSAPTVSIEALMLSCAIDAQEGRSVMTADIPGAFMQADMDDVVFMKMVGETAQLLLQVNKEKYENFVVLEKGKPVIYVKLKKALYGTLKAALLFWQKLTRSLEREGFKINPYDRCVANKIINGKQCTVLWHVDDIKISHVDPAVTEHVLDIMNAEYGKETPLVVTRGDVHDYLGMTLDFSQPGKCKIWMKDYIGEILDDLPDDMDGEAVTPATENLFHVNDDCTKLDKDTAEMFHSNVAKLLFLCKRARPDVQTAVAFLTTRVKSPDVDDYKKLARVMKYLRGTLNLTLTLEATNLDVVKWWVDGSFAVHPDMRSHTGATMSLGKGSMYATSVRQKLNTKSSTEAELVAVDDVMPQVMWTRYFLEAQGIKVRENIVYQDNQSAMLLEKNGKASSGKRTRHVNIRYFFVTDRVQAKDMSVEWCPTDDMSGDFFTKATQGGKFLKFRGPGGLNVI